MCPLETMCKSIGGGRQNWYIVHWQRLEYTSALSNLRAILAKKKTYTQ